MQIALFNLKARSQNKYVVYDNSRNSSSIYLFSVGHDNSASDMAVVCLQPQSIKLFYLPPTAITFYRTFNILKVTDHKANY